MSCSPFDLRDYFFGELAEPERRQLESHVRNCSACHEDLDRLRITHSTMLALRDEEVPQRIGFVSDKVFEPSPVRRWWLSFWGSSGRLGFASAAMLSVALVVFTFYRPVGTSPPIASAQVDTAKIEAQVAWRVGAAVAKAVAESEARQARKTAEIVAATERRFQEQRKVDMDNVADEVSYLKRRYDGMVLASNEYGGGR
jgi:anti-sigma factor RsiW